MLSILLVEDDEGIIRNLSEFLRGEGFAVTAARGQREALEKLDAGSYSLLLLDVSLPDGSGYAVCAAARARGDTPVIFLTASGDEMSVVAGLEMGADDYIAKPFRPRELMSRIRTVLRRSGRSAATIRLGPICVDTVRAQVTRDGEEIVLGALEYRLLLALLNNRGVMLSRSRLLEELWDVSGVFVNDNTLSAAIMRLRKKLGDEQEPALIKTVRGMGYMIE